MKCRNIIAFIVLGAFCALFAQIPFSPNDVLNTFGEDVVYPDGSFYLHPGLDLCGNAATTQVTPVENGCIYACVQNEEGGYDIRTQSSCSGDYGWIYGHMDSLCKDFMDILRDKHKIRFTPLLKFTIAPRTGTCPHLHLEKVRYCQHGWHDADNPIAYISPISDCCAPEIEDYGYGYDLFLCRNEQWSSPFTTKDNCEPPHTIVNGLVDFSAKVTDKIMSLDVGIYAVGYRVEDMSGAIVVSEKLNYARGIIYHPGFNPDMARATSTRLCEAPSLYKVSNCTGGIFDIPSLRGYWDTDFLPDCLYRIIIIAKDYAHPKVKREFVVRVDNFPPEVDSPTDKCPSSELRFPVSEELDPNTLIPANVEILEDEIPRIATNVYYDGTPGYEFV